QLGSLLSVIWTVSWDQRQVDEPCRKKSKTKSLFIVLGFAGYVGLYVIHVGKVCFLKPDLSCS
ncbi:MAG: hypothetical protein AMS23_10750, partial [Bacteroides sp. SM1_62]